MRLGVTESVKQKAIKGIRAGLERTLSNTTTRKVAEKTISELRRALTESGTYGGGYFGRARNPLDRMGLSGYERYDRDTSNANAIALPVWRHFPVAKTLDVGCATGFVVEALAELGIDSVGTDLSYWAVEHPADGAKGRLRQGDLLDGLPFADGEFELSTCLEVLEHMPPSMIPAVLREIRRVTSKYVVATIPTFGENEFGPGGWLDVKVRPEVLDEYRAKGPSYTGPVPPEDLYLDVTGEPIEGHICMASFDWWTAQFEAAGFIRCGETELDMHVDFARYGQTEYWNLYVFRTPDAPELTGDVQLAADIAHWEKNFGLDTRPQKQRDYDRLNEALVRNNRKPIEPTNLIS